MATQYVGIDLHRRRSVIVRQDAEGEVLEKVRIDNDPVALACAIERAGPDPQVVLEATYGWYWAADVLKAAGARVHLAHPLGVKGFCYRRVKNDERDAADLADLVRLNRLPQAWIAPPGVRELRELGVTAPNWWRCAQGSRRKSTQCLLRKACRSTSATSSARPVWS
ncbi:MAG TPA: transposase [Rubrobacteraceae bacterium]|nr:transposase [Rubrobacteraceae bacterium]